MNKLFVVNSDFELDLNKEWLHLVPEFSVILHRKWKVEGDSDGRKKLMQRRLFGYMYLIFDYASPLLNFDTETRHQEALRMMKLKEGDLQSEGVGAAMKKFEFFVENSSRILKTLRVMYTVLDKMDEHLRTIDFTAVDKQGKLLYTTNSVIKSMKDMNSMYDSIQQLERRVMDDLKKEANTIRGSAILGGKEAKVRDGVWEETGPQIEQQELTDETLQAIKLPTSMQNLGAYISELTKEEEEG